MNLVELIAKKRNGAALLPDEIEALVQGHSAGDFADYQMTALLMAIFFQGMTPQETAALTQAMLHSGDTIDLSDIKRRKVDKHSTGGVGDKVSLCLAPLVAACGVAVPMISGRGLGHTGGTLDKLEAIAGFEVGQSVADFRSIVDSIGCCMIGQTATLAPADKRIYALRDVTATVESIPLIVASILSKKLAEGIDALVLDVKVGRGAFMKDLARATELAEALVAVGSAAGKQVSALLTDMSQPLGRTVGNAMETAEAIAVLHGEGPDDLVECTLALGAEMLRVGQVVGNEDEGREALLKAIESGAAAQVFERMIAAQGGDPGVVSNPERMPQAPERVAVLSDSDGFVATLDALEIGLTAVNLGAGRTRADQAVDHAVGIELCCKVGDAVQKDQPLAVLHVRDAHRCEKQAIRVKEAFHLAERAPQVPDVVMKRILVD